MRSRNNPNAHVELNYYDRYISSKEKLQELIKNENKIINIEIGMGKGEFISNLAYLNPDVMYIGIELSQTVLALAIKKIKRFEEEKNATLKNLYLMSFDASDLCEMFDNNQINKIYLNFSDPWPKKRHEKRRLTHENFLKLYKKVLIKDGVIEFKTDNRSLFEFSICSVNNFGLKIHEVYLDLHKTEVFNILTEYEQKFFEKGPIYKMILS
ncbi:MAG: tRNA (guanosine(46)-N7)-methyltransferase TrmB [Clostridia bacterium]|nr:tRNA (guanosine(46)-N7)-methyltransferase TrmB [Clostridia bacterium]